MAQPEFLRCCYQCDRAMCRVEASLRPRDRIPKWFCSGECAEDYVAGNPVRSAGQGQEGKVPASLQAETGDE